jgi:hypothetical protein
MAEVAMDVLVEHASTGVVVTRASDRPSPGVIENRLRVLAEWEGLAPGGRTLTLMLSRTSREGAPTAHATVVVLEETW